MIRVVGLALAPCGSSRFGGAAAAHVRDPQSSRHCFDRHGYESTEPQSGTMSTAETNQVVSVNPSSTARH
jgi:hypothetical protein